MEEFQGDNLRSYLGYCYDLFKEGKGDGQFPHGVVDYPAEYDKIEDYLNTAIHKEVVALAGANGAGYLNDHGVPHIDMVKQRVSILLKNGVKRLSGYETFLLLLAIHFHDVGNVYGREGHEKGIGSVVYGCQFPEFMDETIIRLIIRIAAAHGGRTEADSKDTIAELEDEVDVNGIKVRPMLLASILRFADEIADDKTRTSKVAKRVGAIPNANLLFHRYSAVLQPVCISDHDLHFQFDLDVSDVSQTYDKYGSDVLLYDEILTRMRKCYCELIYCAKYAEGLLSSYRTIRVDVRVYRKGEVKEIYAESFRLSIGGYPCHELQVPLAALPGEPPFCKSGEELQRKMKEKGA